MWTYLKELNQNEGTTIFFTTHYMEEADNIAQRVAIIDRGKIIALGTSQELKRQTSTQSLEKAFLALTGETIREESASSTDQMRTRHRMWRR
jgi:ABC-2 type transport system ATP-binding protein